MTEMTERDAPRMTEMPMPTDEELARDFSGSTSEMAKDLAGMMSELIESGEMDADEAGMMLEFLGTPESE
jgi:hypothetical protein